jgi:hypothetical protein
LRLASPELEDEEDLRLAASELDEVRGEELFRDS